MKKILFLISISVLSLFSKDIYMIEESSVNNFSNILTDYDIEPSGITYGKNNQLFIVSDNGKICFFDKNKFICQSEGSKFDFEGISYSQELDIFFLADEETDSIFTYRFYQNKFIRLGNILIPKFIGNNILLKAGGNGIEAVSFMYIENNRIFLAITNQSKILYGNDSSRVIIISLPLDRLSNPLSYSKIEDFINFPIRDLSGLFFINNKFLITSDKKDLLIVFDNSNNSYKLFNLPGIDQEGVFLDKNSHFIFISQDSGGIIKFKIPELKY